MAGQRKPFHVLAGDVPALGDHLRAAELRDLLVAVALQPAGGLRGGGGETELPAEDHGRGDRDPAHVLHTTRQDQIRRTGHDRLGAKGNRLLTGSALPVDGDAGNLLGVAGRKPGQPADIAGLPADGVDASDNRVLDGGRVDVVAVEDAAKRVRAEVDRVHARQRTIAFADRRAHRVDHISLRHVGLPCRCCQWLSVLSVPAAIPPRTMARYCLPTCSAVSGPPG